VQATVRSFDQVTGSGTVFLDDGTVCVFGAGVFALSGFRLLRAGQRVAIRLGPAGEVTALTLPTLPLPPGDANPGKAPPTGTAGGAAR
jgi:cold shock CspA family protein